MVSFFKHVEDILGDVCVFFSNDFSGKNVHQKLGTLIKTPFTKYKDAIERFNKRSNCEL